VIHNYFLLPIISNVPYSSEGSISRKRNPQSRITTLEKGENNNSKQKLLTTFDAVKLYPILLKGKLRLEYSLFAPQINVHRSLRCRYTVFLAHLLISR